MADAQQEGEAPKKNGVRKSAVLLMALGEQDAAEILKHMGPKEVQRLGAQMASLEDVTQSEVEGTVAEFIEEVGKSTGLGIGADDYIRSMLTSALGEDKANGLIDRILLGGNTAGLDTLKWMDSRAVADIIRNEHPQIQAIVISYLESDQSAEVLANFDEKVRLDIIMRVATLDVVQPAALQELNDILEKQFANNASTQRTQMGGVKVAADIVNNVDSKMATEILEQIHDVDDDIGTKIEDLMFVFDNLKDVDDRDMQTLLRELSTEQLVLALKGAEEDMQEKIFKNMSKRAAELLRDDLEAKGPVKISEVETAQKEILSIAKELEEQGTISLGGAGAEQML